MLVSLKDGASPAGTSEGFPYTDDCTQNSCGLAVHLLGMVLDGPLKNLDLHFISS